MCVDVWVCGVSDLLCRRLPDLGCMCCTRSIALHAFTRRASPPCLFRSLGVRMVEFFLVGGGGFC